MKKVTVTLMMILALATGAQAKACVDRLDDSKVNGLTIQPVSVEYKTTHYADASVEEESVVTSQVTTFRGSPSKVEAKCDEDVIGIDY